MATPPEARMTREEFKALAQAKGWKFTMLAQRWGVTPEWISHISRDPRRDLCYDDALFGLPDLNRSSSEVHKRERTLAKALETAQQRVQARPPRKRGAGYRYQGYLRQGSILTVSAAFGSVAEEGERGIVVEVSEDGREESYRVVFESGASERFSPDAVDTHLAGTGLVAPGCESYRYLNGHRLRQDFQAGRFEFWPVS